ncbi:rho GTPase-activating protein 12a isoform X2 [Danio rerio]|uniref:Rho GTPase-activating protein 12a isoform X2 n=2 Tax=Danio rerio TaxID=7955 RepID=A0A8M2BIT3_DANRE|nr:rho GTPase activating protein 12a isoform X2 [Danio rerio]|eukprot:XP_005171442.1 rho GTPase activating protein 12a isoform X2 [Danio rerio]
MADRSIAPGQTYIEVEYDYDYKSKDRLITIKHGESYLLVKKTNDDWWQVRKDDASKPFYVPAQYVREVRRALMPPPKPLNIAGRGGPAPNRPSALEIQRPNDNKKSPCPSPSSTALLPPRDDRGSPVSPTRHLPPAQMNTFPGSLPCFRAESPGSKLDGERDKDKDSERKDRGEKAAVQEELAEEGGDSDKNRIDSESGDELSSGSTDNLQSLGSGQGRPDSPVYTNLQEMKISQSSTPPLPSSSPIHTNGDWETHKDQNGRHYYYNRSTQERTWKPPRARDSLPRKEEKHDMTDTEVLSSEENCLSSQSDSQYGSPPRGWSEEMDEHGHTLYVCDYTNEKWLRHTDERGRLYYYSADGSRSEWELPKIGLKSQSNHTPLMPGDLHKTRSLDRRLPDPIPISRTQRHSIYSHETNDKDTKTGSPDSDSSCPSSPKPPHSPSEKCATLNMTKITEHGKKVRKNWTSYWTVLQGSLLIFNKGQGGGSGWFGRDQKSSVEYSVDLKGGSVDWASKDKSSKKHVLELKTRQGTELLLQSDSDGLVNDWHKALTEAIHTYMWESDEAIEEDMPESPENEKHDKEKDRKNSKKARDIKKTASMDNAEQKKKNKLVVLLLGRPTLQAVKDKGYIKDQVFGCSLSSLCQRENSTVPRFVWLCIEQVEKNGLGVDGLYRVSGNLAIIQKLRFAVNHEEKIDLGDSKWEDIHVTTGALKMFFRELPEPLFTYTFFSDFISAIKMPDYKQKVQTVKDLMKKLPRPNHDTIQVLFKHLKKVIQHVDENRMTTQSVAIVFGPTLLRPEIETANMAVHMVYQNQIVELILMEYDTIFGR